MSLYNGPPRPGEVWNNAGRCDGTPEICLSSMHLDQGRIDPRLVSGLRDLMRNACPAGARGGRDQFNWENVKSDKDREFYLGHSVKATTGRWQKG